MNKKIVIIGAGVAGINAATTLIDNGYPGNLITIIDKGNCPNTRKPEEVMTGMLGAGGWSDGKLTYHTAIGGQLSKYCGEDKAMELMDQVISNFRRFHPKPEEIFCSDPSRRT
jgi:glycine/D-amino acid oxidase-like deaminating enzyme